MSHRPAPPGFAEGTAAAPTGAPAAHCFYIRREEPRGLRSLVTRYAMGAIRYLRPKGITGVGKRRVRGRPEWPISTGRERDFNLFSIVVNEKAGPQTEENAVALMLADEGQHGTVEDFGLLPISGVTGLGNDQKLGSRDSRREKSHHRRRSVEVGVTGQHKRR